MTIEEVIRVAVAEALRAEAPAIFAELSARSRLISIRELPVNFRLILAAEKAGEIRVYRRGKFSAVDETEFYDWVKKAPAVTTKVRADPIDEIGALIDIGERRRRTRKLTGTKG